MVDHHSARQVRTLSGCRWFTLSFAVSMCLLPGLSQTGKGADNKCKAGAGTPGCAGKGTAAVPSPTPAQSTEKVQPPAAAAFPFPTEDSLRGGDATDIRPAAGRSSLPAMPTDPVPDPPASSERPLHLPPGYAGSSSSGGDDAPASGAGTSSSRTADDDDVAPTSAAPDAPVKSSALKDLGSRADMSVARSRLAQTRVADDLKVGAFYLKDGNAQGAYLRFKDAADQAPDDPDARFNLAEAAVRLNKHDEAVLNYREYLKLDPGGDHDKASRKALGRLGSATQ